MTASVTGRTVRLVATVACALALTGPAGAQAAPRPFRVNAVDAVAVAAFATAAVLPFALDLPDGPPDCAPCDPGDLPGIDRGVVGWHSSGAGTASDILVWSAMAGAAWLGVGGAPQDQRWGAAASFAEAISATYAATGWLKVAVGRERPVMYGSGAAAAAGDPDSQRSFPSSHTAAAFAAATWYVTASQRLGLQHRGRNAAILFVAAAVVGGLRMAAGDHFPTDVLAGAALGAGTGWAAAALHP